MAATVWLQPARVLNATTYFQGDAIEITRKKQGKPAVEVSDPMDAGNKKHTGQQRA
jgi:phosphopantetheinyl transferase